MSLHQLAKHMAAQGRNGDSTLVHMTPSEVAQMQHMAQQRGGSLTINPHTGLPEASFLSSLGLGDVDKFIAPIGGAALSFFSDGAIDPATAGMLLGGGTALATGDLSKGLQAGIGAWGGASLAGGLGAAGLGSTAPGMVDAATAEAGRQGLTGEAYNKFVQDEVTKNLAGTNLYSAGASSAASDPMAYLKDVGGGSAIKGGLPLLAALSGASDIGSQQGVTAPKFQQGYIRPSVYDPVHHRFIDQTPVKVEDWGNRSFANGGAITNMADGGSAPVSTGNAIYDYLTGKSKVNPVTIANTNAPYDPTVGLSDGDQYFDYKTGMFKTYHAPGGSTSGGTTGGASTAPVGTTPPVVTPPPQTGGSSTGTDTTGGSSATGTGITGLPSGRIGEGIAVANNALSNAGQIITGKLANLFSYKPVSPEDAAKVPVVDMSGTPTVSGSIMGYGPNPDAIARDAAQPTTQESRIADLTSQFGPSSDTGVNATAANISSPTTDSQGYNPNASPSSDTGVNATVGGLNSTPANPVSQDPSQMGIQAIANNNAFDFGPTASAAAATAEAAAQAQADSNADRESQDANRGDIGISGIAPDGVSARNGMGFGDTGGGTFGGINSVSANPMSQDPSQMGIQAIANTDFGGDSTSDNSSTSFGGDDGAVGDVGVGGYGSESGIGGDGGVSGSAGDGGYGGYGSGMGPGGESGPGGDGGGRGDGGDGGGGGGGAAHGGLMALAAGGKGTSLRGVMGALHGTERLMTYADGGVASGQYNLGSYSDGGRLLRGPGDGVSDSIPATIGHNQPARLADGEFVFPARIVSEIGNGSTEAGARKLYQMMARIQAARGKTVGKDKVATDTKAEKYLSH